MKELTRPNVDTLAKEATSALKEIAERHGVTFKKNRGNFSSTKFTFKGSFIVQENSEGKSHEQVNFETNCHYYGLKPEDFGKELVTLNGTMTIVGLNTRAKKYPILIKTDKGDIKKCAERYVKSHMQHTIITDIAESAS